MMTLSKKLSAKVCMCCIFNYKRKSFIAVVGMLGTLLLFATRGYFLPAKTNKLLENKIKGKNLLRARLETSVNSCDDSLIQTSRKYDGLTNQKISGRDLLLNHFKIADKNGDGRLSQDELYKKIRKENEMSFQKAVESNARVFVEIDTQPRNGLISKEEYIKYFIANRFNNDSTLENKLLGLGITGDDVALESKLFAKLPHSVRVEFSEMEAKWFEAGSSYPNSLTIDEFLAFEHPQVSPSKIIQKVQDTISTFDLNGDSEITQKEMKSVYKEAEGIDPNFGLHFFLIDSNKDGKITQAELLQYMDPKKKLYSLKEAKKLLGAVDINSDGELSLQEVLNDCAVMIQSQFFDGTNSEL